MFFSVFFKNETGNIGTVNSRLGIAALHRKPVSPIGTIQADGTVFTVDSDSRTVFALDSDGTVFSGRPRFTDGKLVIQLQIISGLTIIVCLGNKQVSISTIFLPVHFNDGMFPC